MPQPKRSAPRVEFVLEGTVTLFDSLGKEVKRSIRTQNLSIGGIYMLTDTPSFVGDQIRIDFRHAAAPVKQREKGLIGSVLRVDKLSGDSYGVAVVVEEVAH